MRDQRRIDRVLTALGHYWHRYPDLRLGQIIGNAAEGDPYHYEDDALLVQLEAWLADPKHPAAETGGCGSGKACHHAV